MPAGRPSEYDPQIAADICLSLSVDSKSIVVVCDSQERFPSANTFYRWMLDHPELREMYARAKDAQLQILADEIQQIADETQVGEIITIKGDEREVKISDMLEHRRLRIESRKWLLAKLAPKKYGDTAKLALTDPDGGPLRFVLERIGGNPEEK